MTKTIVEQNEFKQQLDEGAFPLTKAHAADAGWDIKTREEIMIEPHSSAIFHTGVHIQIPFGYVAMLQSKSGLNIKYDITSTGTIDSGYSGEIIVKLYNHGNHSHYFAIGDKISQIVIYPIYSGNIEMGDVAGGDRGANGFGSTGK